MSGPPRRHNIISTGNETFDKFLGGGLLNSSLNLFERRGPSSRPLDAVLNKSLAAATLKSKENLIVVNFNTCSEISREEYLSSLPLPREVKSELLYKDIRGKSATAKIKIAWRYSHRNSSPSNNFSKSQQIDFGLSLIKEVESNELGLVRIINVEKEFNLKSLLNKLTDELIELKGSGHMVNIILKDVLHPFSPLLNKDGYFCKFLYALRCFARTIERGAILLNYDIDLCRDHQHIKEHLYNMADCVVTFYSYETGENRLTGYKHTEGTLDYLKVPKLNSFGSHFQRELSDWGYRFTKNHRYFVVDELNLPPADDDEDDKAKEYSASELMKIPPNPRPLQQVGPLEDLKEVAKHVLSKEL